MLPGRRLIMWQVKLSWPHAVVPEKRNAHRLFGKWFNAWKELMLPRLKINGCVIFILNFRLTHAEGLQTFKCKCAEQHQWPGELLLSTFWRIHGAQRPGGPILPFCPLCEATVNSVSNSTPTPPQPYVCLKQGLCFCKAFYFVGLKFPFSSRTT